MSTFLTARPILILDPCAYAAALRQRAQGELRALSDPEQTAVALALAFATGTLLGFLPVPFLDSLLLALLLTRARRLNRPALLAGKMIWNELLVLPLYQPALRLGGLLLGAARTELTGPAAHALAFVLGLGLVALLAAGVGAPLFALAVRVRYGHPPLGYRAAAGRVPFIALFEDYRAQALHGRGHFSVGRVQRGQADADGVRGAEVGQYTHFGDEGLIDGKAVRVAQGDVRAAPRRTCGGVEIETKRSQFGPPLVHQKLAQAQRFGTHGGQGGLAQQVYAGGDAAQGENGRRAAEEAAQAGGGPVGGIKVKEGVRGPSSRGWDCASCSCRSRRTKRKAGAPGPPLRYL